MTQKKEGGGHLEREQPCRKEKQKPCREERQTFTGMGNKIVLFPCLVHSPDIIGKT